MTAKEKAKELKDKFKIGDVVTKKLQVVNIDIYSKLFALIAVEEILKLDNPNTYNYLTESKEHLIVQLADNYWQEVKQEIENL